MTTVEIQEPSPRPSELELRAWAEQSESTLTRFDAEPSGVNAAQAAWADIVQRLVDEVLRLRAEGRAADAQHGAYFRGLIAFLEAAGGEIRVSLQSFRVADEQGVSIEEVEDVRTLERVYRLRRTRDHS